MSTQLKASNFDHIAEDGTIRRFKDAKPLNTSGIVPLDHRLLVLHDPISDTFEGTSLLRPDQERDKQKYAQTKATVIALGDMCWAEAKYDARRFGVEATFPEAGNRVLVGRYTGDTHKGADGKDYTVLNDEDVIAFIDKSEG
jgi:co-chaperonin GroES (HSP10)